MECETASLRQVYQVESWKTSIGNFIRDEDLVELILSVTLWVETYKGWKNGTND